MKNAIRSLKSILGLTTRTDRKVSRRSHLGIEPLEARIAPAVILNKGGAGYAGNGGGGPPDVTGMAGPNSYIEVNNSAITIFSKPDGTILATHGVSDFFYNAAIGNETLIYSQTVAIAAGATGAAEAGNTVTITTTAPHGFISGQKVSISGVGVAGYNGSFNITVATPTTFTYTDSTAGLASSGGGSASDSSCGVCDSTGVFDNLMGTNGRFIIGDIDINAGRNVSQYIFAVSKTSNPTALDAANWNFYHVTTTEGPLGASSWSDYPGNAGFNADAFVETFNMFGSGPAGTQVISIKASDLAAGNPVIASGPGQNVFSNDVPGGARSYRATTMHDAAAGDPMWLIHNPGDGTHLDVVKMTSVLSAAPSFVATSLSLPAADQFIGSGGIGNPLNPDGSGMFDVGSRILKAGESNKTIVATHTVAVAAGPNTLSSFQPNDFNGNPTGGMGYTVGDTVTVNGGTFTTPAQLKVQTLGPGGSIATATVTNAGSYTSLAGVNGSVSGGTGSGTALSLFFSGELDAQWYAIDVSGATPVFQKVGGVDNVGRVGFGAKTYSVEPGIDINSSGQIGLGFMESDTAGGAANAGSGGFVSTFVTARYATDAAGTMESSVLVPAGKGSGNINGRVGDFSGLNVDPVNGTFWHVNEFGGGGPTDIANFTPSFSTSGAAENLTIRVTPGDSTMNQVLITGTNTVVATFPNNSPVLFAVQGDGGNNTLTVDEHFGVVNTPLLFDGGGSPGAPGDQMIVIGDDGNDALQVTPTGTNSATSADLSFDGSAAYSFRNIQQLGFNGVGGNDTMTVDSTTSLLSLSNGILYDGGLGQDALKLLQTGGSQASDVYSIGLNNGDGSSVIKGATGTQTVQFQNIEPTLDLVPAISLFVNATSANNAINYSKGSVAANGLVTIDNFESIEFSNKTHLTINGLEGSDEISLHNDVAPTALTDMTVGGGDPTGSDKLLITGTALADAFTFAPLSLSAGDVTGVVLPIHFTGIEHLVLDGAAGDDTFNLNGANGHVSLLGNAGADRVNFSTAASGVIFDLDAVGVDQRVTSTDALVTLLDRMENFTGTNSPDILRITASPFPRDVFGGLPSMAPGDKLVIDGQGAAVTVMKTDPNTGTVKIKGYADITFDEFESFAITNSPSSPGGFGPPGDNSGAFNTAHAYSLTKFLIAGKPAPGKGPTAVATGDLNGDGFADIVSTDSITGNISVLINQGDGTFFDPVNIKTGGGRPQDLVIGQFDASAGLDVVVTNLGSKNLSLFSGNGLGGFAAPLLIPVAAQPYAIAAGNFNGGAQDIVITHLGSKQVGVLLGTGTGLGTETLFGSGGAKPIDVAVGDFNGDTFTDVVTANNGSASVSLLNGNGAGALAAPVKFKVGVNPTGVAVGDFDLDGKPDVAVSNFISRFVSVLLTQNAGAAIFKPELRVVLPGYRAPTSITAGDLDGDGQLDLVLADSRGTNITALLGNGPATFTQPYSFNLGKFDSRPKIGGVALADLNNDGLLDIVTSVQGNDDIRVLLRHV